MKDENKESKLEKYTWKDALIPFSCIFSKKAEKPNKEWTKREHIYGALNAIGYSVLGFSSIIYFGMALTTGSLNSSKWGEIQKQEKEFRIKNCAIQNFQKYDTDKNLVLDSTEFYNYYKSKSN